MSKKRIISLVLAFLLAFAVPSAFSSVASERQNGVWAEYFSDEEFKILRTSRKEPTIDDTFSEEHISARFTGYVYAPTAGAYTIYIDTDDGAKLFIDGDLVIADNGPHFSKEQGVVLNFAANSYHEFRLDYYNGLLSGTCKLLWTRPGGSKTIIPAGNLFMPDTDIGEENIMTIDPSKVIGTSNTLFGACMEDVNHEIYGGIYSQMIYGESFAEPAQTASPAGFTIAGGNWKTEPIGGGKNQLSVSRADGGPKLTFDNVNCEDGEVSVDIKQNDPGPAGFILKTSESKPGADNFNGYEIGLSDNILRLGRHQYDYLNIGNYPCSAPKNAWNNLRVIISGSTFTVFVNNVLITTYTDENPGPLANGVVGLRSWDADASFRNLIVSTNEIIIPEFDPLAATSNMWLSVKRGEAVGRSSLTYDAPYKGTQSQRVTFTSGVGAIGINNMFLNRKGMNFESGKEYEGYFYARSQTPVTVYALFESADGSTKYAEKSITVSGNNFEKYSLDGLIPNDKDAAGRFTLELRSAGTVDFGYVFLQLGAWGRYKDLPVRKDVVEAMIEQKVTVLRYGGCMAQLGDNISDDYSTNAYRWKNMLGDPETRPSYNGWWFDHSSNGFGIVDFLNLCEAMEIAAVPDFNLGESAQSISDFIDFAMGTDTDNVWVKKRIEMGHPAPYKLEYLEYGNENRIDAAFATRFNAMANAVWAKAPNITLIAGDFDYKDMILDPYKFTGAATGITTLAGHKSIIDNASAKGKRVWFDIHFWTDDANNPLEFYTSGISLYKALKLICPTGDFALPVFELNSSLHNTSRALGNAVAITTMAQHSDIFPIICSANALQVDGHNDNGWDQGLVFMNNDTAWLEPPAYVTQMANSIEFSDIIPAKLNKVVDGIDFYNAVKSADGKSIAVSMVNSSDTANTITLNLKNFTGNANNVTITSLSSDALSDVNGPEGSIRPQTIETQNAVVDGKVEISVPKYSYVVVNIVALSDPPPPSWIYGDLDDDKQVTAIDALIALKIAVEIQIPTPDQIDAATNGKGEYVTIEDVLKLLEFLTEG